MDFLYAKSSPKRKALDGGRDAHRTRPFPVGRQAHTRWFWAVFVKISARFNAWRQGAYRLPFSGFGWEAFLPRWVERLKRNGTDPVQMLKHICALWRGGIDSSPTGILETSHFGLKLISLTIDILPLFCYDNHR